MRRFFLRIGAPPPLDSGKRIRLYFAHPGFHAQFSRFRIHAKYFCERCRPLHDGNRFAPQLRFDTHQRLNRKIGNEKACKSHKRTSGCWEEERKDKRTNGRFRNWRRLQFASPIERNRQAANRCANAALPLLLQSPEMFSLLPSPAIRRHYSIFLHGGGNAKPAKRSSLRNFLLLPEAGWPACSPPPAGNETTCSARCDALPPKKYSPYRTAPLPNRLRAAVNPSPGSPVLIVSRVSCSRISNAKPS